MVSFKLGKEIEKDVLRLQLSRDWNEEKILGPHEIRFLMGTQFFLCPRLVTRRKTSYLLLSKITR